MRKILITLGTVLLIIAVTIAISLISLTRAVNAQDNGGAVAKRGKGVIPAKAGIQDINEIKGFWIPVCTGMTEKIGSFVNNVKTFM